MERVVKLCDFDWSTGGVADDLLGGIVVEWAAAGVGEDGQGGGGWTDKGGGEGESRTEEQFLTRVDTVVTAYFPVGELISAVSESGFNVT